MTRTTRTLVEVFGHSPLDTTPAARKFWDLCACPFIGRSCTKYDHTRTICYGTCAVGNGGDDIIICPNRFYANNYATIAHVAKTAFGDVPFMLFDAYLTQSPNAEDCVVALGQNSGREVKIKKLSMDWVLARILKGRLVEYVGLEVQSIDITGNYRDAWYAARDMAKLVPPSGHGLNWANVHKRLIPQLIRKGLVYSRSRFVKKGMYFIVPEAVYKRFEDVVGKGIPSVAAGPDTLTVMTYKLGGDPGAGQLRGLELVQSVTMKLEDFSDRFISGPNLPSGDALDGKIRQLLAVK